MGSKGSGRKPKPLEQHIADGTYRPERHGPIDPDKRVSMEPLKDEPPAYLDSYARAVWNRVYAVAVEAGLLTEGERALFICYCVSAGRFHQATEELTKNGIVKKPKKQSKPAEGEEPKEVEGSHLNVWYRISRDAVADMTRLASLLGLSTVDRSRVVRAKPPTPPAPVTRPRSYLDRLGPIKLRPPEDAG